MVWQYCFAAFFLGATFSACLFEVYLYCFNKVVIDKNILWAEREICRTRHTLKKPTPKGDHEMD